MRRKIAPPLVLPGIAFGFALLVVSVVLALTLRQPWLGLTLAAPSAVAVEEGEQGLRVVAVSPGSPAARAGLAPGERLVRFGDMALEAGDLLEEPDMIASFTELDRFFARQEALAQALAGSLREQEPLLLHTASGRMLSLPPPAAWRPIREVPAIFWGQLLTGLCGFLFGIWVLSLRRDGWAEGFLFLAGAGLMLSAHAAAVYSTRELALPALQFRLLTGLNHLGALGFGMGMLGLFLCYPARLAGWIWQLLPVVVLGGWWLANQMRLFPEPEIGFQLPVLLALLGIAALLMVQLRRARADPRARAALRWVGLSVLLGAGAFVVTIILPLLLGFEAVLPQGVAFLFFLPIYGGLALAVARYRLFDLQDWAYRVLFYMGGMVVLVLLDAALITLVAFERAPAFGVSLLVVGLLYLPLRDRLVHRLFGRRRRPHEELYRDMATVALTRGGAARLMRWQALLREEFDPLTLEVVPPSAAAGVAEARLMDDGAVLELPAVDDLPSLRLVWARAGRALFTSGDRAHASDLLAMLRGATESRQAYESGATEERSRIARDMHDNIGIQLTGALHSPSVERKDALIREALGDLREILSNAERSDHDLDELLADLRASLSDHVLAAGLAMRWQAEGPAGLQIPPREAHALRSVLREAVGNAIRHSKGTFVHVSMRFDHARLGLRIEDDGIGLQPGRAEAGVPSRAHSGQGHGLANMQARVAGFRGRLEIGPRPGGGVRVEGEIPLGSGDIGE